MQRSPKSAAGTENCDAETVLVGKKDGAVINASGGGHEPHSPWPSRHDAPRSRHGRCRGCCAGAETEPSGDFDRGAAGGSGMQGPQSPYWTDQVVRRVPTPNPPDWIRALADESEKYLAAWTDRRKLRMKGLDADIDCLRLPRATKVRMQLRRDDKIESEHSSMYEKYEVALKAFLGKAK